MLLNQYFQAYQLSHPSSGPQAQADPLGWPKIVKKFLCFSGCFWQKGTHYIFSAKIFFYYLLGPGVFLRGPGLGSSAHFKIFENNFYKYILKTAFSLKSKMKLSCVCLSYLLWTIYLLMQLSFLKNYFANIPDELF